MKTLDGDRAVFVYQSMDQEQAQKQYMEILRSWPGYGSTLFDVEVCNAIISSLAATKYHMGPVRPFTIPTFERKCSSPLS